ncbi:MAG: SDR family NAD(P)-dependent oxidoreductase [Sphingomonadaceae bacterium]|nr:SDR family NAD(P)-dependent oxidoreductase [Sphingomonadaceae bacterium]
MAFAGQAVWITGASSGIGAALARELAARGARLILSGRNEAALAGVAADCPDHLVLPFDTTDYASLPAMVEQAESWSGGVDMLVNNAGISQRSLAKETAFPVYQRIVDVDLLAPIALTQALLPAMVARQSGRLVFVSSVAGKVGAPLRTAYSAAKFGIIGYADALRTEMSVEGISVHTIAPGSVQTDVSRNALTADGSQRGRSDEAIENGIPADEAARDMIDAIAAGEREIIVARGVELQMGEMRKTPDALFDQLAAFIASGYAQQMEEDAGK